MKGRDKPGPLRWHAYDNGLTERYGWHIFRGFQWVDQWEDVGKVVWVGNYWEALVDARYRDSDEGFYAQLPTKEEAQQAVELEVLRLAILGPLKPVVSW